MVFGGVQSQCIIGSKLCIVYSCISMANMHDRECHSLEKFAFTGISHETLCRFCHREVEDEVHALLVCDADAALLDLRVVFKQDIHALIPNFQRKSDRFELLTDLLRNPHVAVCLAKYIYDVLNVFKVVCPCSCHHPTCIYLLYRVHSLYVISRGLSCSILSLAWFCEKTATHDTSCRLTSNFQCIMRRAHGQFSQRAIAEVAVAHVFLPTCSCV
jgi:hypothetical protein